MFLSDLDRLVIFGARTSPVFLYLVLGDTTAELVLTVQVASLETVPVGSDHSSTLLKKKQKPKSLKNSTLARIRWGFRRSVALGSSLPRMLGHRTGVEV